MHECSDRNQDGGQEGMALGEKQSQHPLPERIEVRLQGMAVSLRLRRSRKLFPAEAGTDVLTGDAEKKKI